jgi:ABC-type multidrug transport system permease subunit
MFQGIGDKPMVLQLPFVFILLTVLCMSGMQLMPALIGNRHVMKYETSEALYSELSFMLANAVVDIPLNVTGATMCCVIMYTFSGLPWDYFGTIIGWAILLFFVFDSLFGFIAATAADAQKAQVMAIPFNSIFMLFSGFMVTKASAPVFLRWIFQISPNAYAMQAIVLKMAETNPEGPAIVEQYGFKEGEEAKGLCVMVALIVVLRTLQFLSLKFRNSIQR